MKKNFVCATVFMMIAGMAWAEAITVTSPRASDVLCKGRTYAATWTSSVKIARVMIRLVRGGVVAANLSWGTDNDGHFEFAVAGTVPEGDYRIVVADVANRTHSGESGIFHVSACTVTPAPPSRTEIMPQIIVISPNGPPPPVPEGMDPPWVKEGEYFEVKWRTVGPMPEVVTVSLHPDDRSGEGVYLSTANTAAGRQVVKIPVGSQNNATRTYMSIRVGVYHGALAGWGFIQVAKDVFSGVAITDPDRASVWHPGDNVVVRWRGGEGLRVRIGIVLVSEDSIGRFVNVREVLAENLHLSDNERHLTVPAGIAPGRYMICITNYEGDAIGPLHISDIRHRGTFSEIFQVTSR